MSQQTALRRKRLYKLADFLETEVPAEKFNMFYWGGAYKDGTLFSGCAGTWATKVPAFRKAGLKLDIFEDREESLATWLQDEHITELKILPPDDVYFAAPAYTPGTDADSLPVLADLFGLSYREVRYIFIPHTYKTKNGDARTTITRAHVIARIRRLLDEPTKANKEMDAVFM